MKIRPVRAELFHADRQTDRQEANSRFSQFFERTLKSHLSIERQNTDRKTERARNCDSEPRKFLPVRMMMGDVK